MKQHTRIAMTITAILIALSFCVFAAFAAEDAPASDLPVSESYVRYVLNALEEKLTRKIDELSAEVQKLSAGTKPSDTETETTAPEDTAASSETTEAPLSMDYTVVCLKKGQTLTGSCEIILRSGTAAAHCPGANGISDLTAGADLANETAIAPNHLMLVPRDDGRGITVTSAESYLMVRGTYHISEVSQ